VIFLKNKVNLFCIVLYAALCLGFVFINFTPSDNVVYFIIAYSLGFIIVVVLYFKNRDSHNISFTEILFITVSLKIILLFAAPVTSNDYSRYLWDGKVQATGINPFIYAPGDKELEFLQDDKIFPLITYKEIKTIYPPFAQIIFFLNQVLFSGSLFGLKIFFLIFDIGVLVFLCKILLLLKLNANYILIYALSPLILFEIILNVHVDILLLFFLTGSIYFIFNGKYNLSFLMLGFSVMSKFYSAIFLPLFIFELFKSGNSKKIISCVLFFSAPLLLLLIYYNGISDMLGVMQNYESNWYFNALPFKAVAELFSSFGIENHLIVRMLFKSIFVFLLLYYSFSSKPFINKIAVIFFIYFFLNTTVYPWYLIPLSIMLVINFNYTFLFWTGIIGLTNLTVFEYLKTGVWSDNNYILFIEYILLPVLFIYEYRKNTILKKAF